MTVQIAKVVTTEDLNVQEIIRKQYDLRLKYLALLIKNCKLSIHAVSIFVNLSPTTIYRYLNHDLHMKIEKFFLIVVYLRKYMQEHNIPMDKELEEIDQLTRFSNITLDIKEKDKKV